MGIERWWTLYLRSGWTVSGAAVSRAVSINADTQYRSKGSGVVVAQRLVGALNRPQGGGGDFGGCREFGLCHSFHDAPVSGVALFGVNADDLVDCSAENVHDACKEVYLWGAGAGFPCMDGGGPDVA